MLGKRKKQYTPKWWFDGDSPWYQVKPTLDILKFLKQIQNDKTVSAIHNVA